MTHHQAKRLRLTRPSFLHFSIVIACMGMLMSCGDSTAQTQTVPGTWTGRAPRMEVINGITVPPEPAPTLNNSTLAGVDVNKNGVRDDVERKIATYPTNINIFNNAILYAKYYQSIASGPTPTNRDAAMQQLKSYRCSSFDSNLFPSSFAPMGEASILGAIFNSAERRKKLTAYNSKIGAYEGSEVRCE